jgi:NADH-quinone oxidoreductase subunit E
MGRDVGRDAIIPEALRETLTRMIDRAEHPREMAVDVMFALQAHFGHMTDEAMAEGAALLGMTPAELEELATFYNMIHREPVGRYVIHVCDSTVCWLEGHESIIAHLERRLGIRLGETTPDGLFTLLPVCCIGYCDRAPAMLVNRIAYGDLTPVKIDEILEKLKAAARDEASPDAGGNGG